MKILNFVKIIHYYSKLFTGVLTQDAVSGTELDQQGRCRTRWGIGQTLQGSFSAVSKPTFARKYSNESSRRDLHNALLCTALKSHFF